MPSQSPLPFDPAVAPEAAAVHTLAGRALPAEAGVWDELRDADGALRPAWQRFAQALPEPPAGVDAAEDLDSRVGQVAQRIRLDGVTHNVFNEAGVASRPWSLEVLPLLIEPAEWAAIEDGVRQRAELLELALADLYGPQRLLHEGLLPPALLLRHPGWLRPMIGVQPPGGLRLFIVAFDIARGADGRWWLVAQRTQGPSGLGYVMHNRLVISRQFPDAFRDLQVQHIASSYRRLLDTLEQTARTVAGGAAPRIVLLTPGPYAETYFEHAYLARYLGLPLVEGGDLTVRGEHLFLKTVEGLEPVHGVLRRLDDDWCDPLELRPDSALGVPGLLQAARAGTVVMANALGSAFLETPAVQGFLPGIARRLTGEELRLPSLPTWWCGEAAAWQDVAPELPGMIVRSTFPRGGRTSQVYEAGDASIESDPDAWTVQGRLRFSRAPIWGSGVVTPRPAMVRVYAIADAGGCWHVLPGGMTRVARREDSSVSMQRGGTSLDTWVLTAGAVDEYSMLPQRLQVDDILARRQPVSSRTGENLFWLGRYTERTENLVRLARATLLLIGADGDAPAPVLNALSALAVRSGLAPKGVPTLAQSQHLFERALLAGLGKTEPGKGIFSIAYNLVALERSSMALRERLSAEQWGLMRSMREGFALALEAEAGELPSLAQVLPALDRLALQLAAMTGAQTDRMTRDHGWRLLTVGRLLERLIGLATGLGAFVQARALGSAAGVELLLELFDSVITFRARYQRHEDLLALADLLVLDSANPRAFAGVLRRLRTELSKLPGDDATRRSLLAMLPAEGAGLTLEALRGADDVAIAARLAALSARLADTATALAERIGQRYFTLAHGSDQRL
ncbi:MAG: circularly permuted type 2 ATP-grasp protein [Rubrivivax sp.]|nr:circularly permuted type 2 ATP-grasp protein [Rubrivivax sp.]